MLDNWLIIAILIGIFIVLGLWLRSRSRKTGALPPRWVAEDVPAKPELPVQAPPPVVAPAPAPAPVKPGSRIEKPVAKKAVAAAKPAAKKAAPPKKPTARPAPAAPPPMTAIGVPGAVGAPDHLLLLKGVGPKLNTLLIGLGITRFDQIGAWSAEDAAKVDAHLGAFTGRIERDSWIEQARLLAGGAIAEFETKFGKLDSEN